MGDINIKKCRKCRKYSLIFIPRYFITLPGAHRIIANHLFADYINLLTYLLPLALLLTARSVSGVVELPGSDKRQVLGGPDDLI